MRNDESVEYEEIEKSRLEELEDAEEELEALEDRVTLVKNTLFFIFVFTAVALLIIVIPLYIVSSYLKHS